MDTHVERIAAYAHEFSYTALSSDVVHECKRRIIDTMGVALGAYDAEPCQIARAMAQRASMDAGARVLGTAHRALPELAAFANGMMARYLDGNDGYPGGAGHPSDTMAAVMAAADSCGADGASVISAITLAYEIVFAFATSAKLRDKGMDNVFYTAVAGAVAAAKILALDRDGIRQAIALAITPNIALDATRYGHLSMWKAGAGANAARNAVFAAILAARGMTGPDKVLAGEHGLSRLAGEFTLPDFGGGSRPYKITETTLKSFLVEGHALSPLSAALRLWPRLQGQAISKVEIHTYRRAYDVIGSEREKWRPATRETADHSLPYIIAAVLIDGQFSDAIFKAERLRDPRILDLIDNTEVLEDSALTARFPKALPCRIEVTTRDGRRLVEENEYPRGHLKNPMSDEDIEAKFRNLASRLLSPKRIDAALKVMWNLENESNLNSMFDAVSVGQ